jgi:Protein of unknown function (DUF3987)
MSAAVGHEQRYTRSRRCPICDGAETDPRGKAKRCIGFLSTDGQYARCSRGEHAGSLAIEESTQTYVHRLVGDCKCSVRHDGRADGTDKGDSPIVARYDYTSETGVVLRQVQRLAPKSFRQCRPDGRGSWIRNVEGVRHVLYRLPQLLAAKPETTVFIVEGESDANNLAALGQVATTNVGGAGKWRAEYNEALRGRHVVILPDNDEPGRRHAEQVAEALVPVAATVKIVELPGLPSKGDVSDWLAKGGTPKALRALVAAVPAYSQHDPNPTVGVKQASGQVVPLPSAAWPEPDPLPDGLPTVPSFDDRLLPEGLRTWLTDIADRTQCPPEYVAIGVVVSLSAIVGRRCAIRPKQKDDWTVVPNLWGAVVGPPSSMKSPALTEALRPTHRLAGEATERYRQLFDGHPAVLAEAKARRSVVEGAMKQAAKAGNADMAALRAEFEAAADPPEPSERRYVVNDTTVEKLGELLNENPQGLLHYRDELSGWLASLDRDGHENDRAFFLEAWNGAGRYTYDRIGRGTLHIGAACVSMLGGIQPGPLAQYLRGAVRGGVGDDGLMQRFQLIVYPDPPTTWRNVDRWPDSDARNRAFELFKRLDALTPEALGAETDDGLPFLRFDSDAQELFDRWLGELMTRARARGEHAAIEAHLTKYPSLFPSLALLCHLADAQQLPPGPVMLASARRAAAWCDFLEAHTRRVYDAVTAEKLNAARALLARLRTGALGHTFSPREVYRAGWAGLGNNEVVGEALAVLEDHGWIHRTVIAETGGRPRTEYTAHPTLAGARAEEAAK